jgi:hypothetical protein
MNGVSVKWVTPMTTLDSKYAVGASIVSRGKGIKAMYNVYGVMTKEIPLGLEDVSVNANAGVALDIVNGTPQLNPALGVDATFANASNLNVAAEYIFRGKSFALKGSYDLGDGFGVQAGVTDYFAGKGKIFVGGNYTYDLAK